MENVAPNNAQAAIKNCPVYTGRNKDTFGEYKSKLRICLSLYSKPVFEVFQDKAQPSPALAPPTSPCSMPSLSTNGNRQTKTSSFLLLTTPGSANNVIVTFEEPLPDNGAGHVQVAWKALTGKYSGYTKEATRHFQEKLVNTEMEPGQDPDDFVFVLDECRDLLEERGQRVNDKRYDDIIFQALPPEDERIRTASNERRDVGLDDIRHTIHTTYAYKLSHSFNARAGLGRLQVESS